MCIYQIAHNRAIRHCHLSHPMPLALLITKTSDQTRQRRHTLSTCTILTGALSSLCSPTLFPCYSRSIFNRLSGLAGTEPTLSFLHFFSLSTQVSPVSHMASTTILRFFALLRLSSAPPRSYPRSRSRYPRSRSHLRYCPRFRSRFLCVCVCVCVFHKLQ